MNGTGRANLWTSLRRVFDVNTRPREPEPPRNAGLVATTCALGAVLIWFLLTMNESHTAEIEMPTEVVSLPQGQALVSPPPQTVRVEVEGEGFELLKLFFNRPTVPIPATTSSQVDLYEVLPRLPGGVSRRSVVPRLINLQTDERIERRLPVRLRADFRMPQTYGYTGDVRLSPDSVTVSGAARIVNALAAWPTVPQTFDNVRDSLVFEMALSDTLAGFVNVSHPSVIVRVPVDEFTGAEREIDVRVRGLPTSERLVTLDPPVVRVSFRVLVEQYRAAMTAADFFATVSYDDVRRGEARRLVPTLNVPEGLIIRDIEITPPTVGYYTVLAGQ